MNHNIYDMLFSDMARSAMYRAWVVEDDSERPAMLGNWHPEDLEAYVGGEYAKR